MYCIHCGKENSEENAFCQYCGKPIDDSTNAPANNTAAVVSAEMQKKKNKKILIIFGVSLAAILVIVFGVMLTVDISKKISENGFSIGGLLSNSDAYFEKRFKVGDIITFGEYEQDGNIINGKEPIEWIVADSNDGNYLLVSRYILDCKPYDDGSFSGGGGALDVEKKITYEDSSVRRWLQESFSNEAFNQKEKKLILPVSFKEDTITVRRENEYAEDLAFLLSEDEAGKCFAKNSLHTRSDDSIYYTSSPDWIAAVTESSKSLGVYVEELSGGDARKINGNYAGSYFLRNISEVRDNQALTIYPNGTSYPTDVQEKHGIRPAVYIYVTAEDFKPTETEAKGSTVDYLRYYMGTWEKGSCENSVDDGFPDDLIISGYFSGLGRKGEVYIDETAFDFSNLTGDIEHRYKVSDFEYTQTFKGYDAFVDEAGGVRIYFSDDLEGNGPMMCIQFKGSGPDGWGTAGRFRRIGEADPSLRISKEGEFSSNNNIEAQTVTLKFPRVSEDAFDNYLYDVYEYDSGTITKKDLAERHIIEKPSAGYLIKLTGEYTIENEDDGMMFNVETETDGNGNTTLVKLYNDYTIHDYVMTYNSEGRMTSFEHYKYAANESRNVFETKYTFDYNAERQLSRVYYSGTMDETNCTYNYDENGRLTRETYELSPGPSSYSFYHYVNQSYYYDESGKINMIAVSGNTAGMQYFDYTAKKVR